MEIRKALVSEDIRCPRVFISEEKALIRGAEDKDS
jgi:hypothetical protein